jgi:hypothetical protein
MGDLGREVSRPFGKLGSEISRSIKGVEDALDSDWIKNYAWGGIAGAPLVKEIRGWKNAMFEMPSYPELQADDELGVPEPDSAELRRRLRRRTRRSTLLTGPLGDTSKATVQRRTLLGE